MKPITNILIILSLICYVFLPFMTMELNGSVTGFSYTADLITENFSISNTIFALLPFIACFGAVTLNSMKSRHWSHGAGIFIIVGLYFFMAVDPDITLPLLHGPEVVTDNSMEGMPVAHMAVGYYFSYGLTWIALFSCIISLMPLKFNETLEHAIDMRIGKPLQTLASKVGHEIHEDIERIDMKAKKLGSKIPTKKVAKEPKQEPEAAAVVEEPKRHEENPEDYMPKGASEENASSTSSVSEATDEDKWKDYMPK